MLSNRKAVSTIILIILLLCSFVVGALLSYMWVLSSFYLEPENTTSLIITNVDFSVDHADYFYITVMNPSNSPSKTNITEIYFTVGGYNATYKVTNTTPDTLPITLEIATSKTIKCLREWGDFAGNTITVHVSALNASGALVSVKTSLVKLNLQTKFNATVSCRQFNVTVTNDAQSAINLTMTNLYVNTNSVENFKNLTNNQNITLPIYLPIGKSVSLQCLYDWNHLLNPTVRVETLEGYHAETAANANASVLMLITNVAFNEMNSNANEISITLSNSNGSSTALNINDIVLNYTTGNQSLVYHINGNDTSPSFVPYYTLGIGKTVTFDHCIWDWGNHRNQKVTITVNVTQGFTAVSKTVTTPQSLVFDITDLNFYLNDTDHFLAKITNMPVSLGNITVTKIMVNGTAAVFGSQIIPIGNSTVFNCTFDWRSFRGKIGNITVQLSNNETISETVTLPIVDLKLLVDPENDFSSTEGIPYVNITLVNSIFSNKTVNVTQIIFKVGNITNTIDGILTNPTLLPNGYVLNIGSNVAILCPWNWTLYSNQTLTITVQTAEGFSITLQISVPTP
jgi:hypothetical protein